MTIDSKELIIKMLKNDGNYEADPQAYSIHSYVNDWGAETYYVAYYPEEEISLHSSIFCHDIKLLWSRANGFTNEGREVMK